MRIAYTISGLYNSGGMENILLQKANYLTDVLAHEITIITTDQNDRPCYFPKSDKVRNIDLGINYYKHKQSKFWQLKKFYLKFIHRKKLEEVLKREKFDICISLMDFDFEFLPEIKDGSKKFAEFHFSRYYKVLSATNNIVRFLQKIRTNFWKGIIKKYDKFIVLTEKDKKQWGALNNIHVIPNFINFFPSAITTVRPKRIISVGRADRQKGFDLLIEAWSFIQKDIPDWTLDIIGGGDKRNLEEKIKMLHLSNIHLLPPTANIGKEYENCSLYVMSSRYEGLPLVLLEAMSYGLPIVSFDCPCGPSDILKESYGKLVSPEDSYALAECILKTIKDKDWREKASKEALQYSNSFSKEEIMKKWNSLFCSSSNKKQTS